MDCVGLKDELSCSCLGAPPQEADISEADDALASNGTLDWSVPVASAHVVAEKLIRARATGELLSQEAMSALNITMKVIPLIHSAIRSAERCVGWKIAFTGPTCPPPYVGLVPIAAPILAAACHSGPNVVLLHPAARRGMAVRSTFLRRAVRAPEAASEKRVLCAVEAEFCFMLKCDLTRSKGIFFDDAPFTAESVWRCVRSVMPAVEVLGSRIEDVDLETLASAKPTPAEGLADFGLNSFVVLGEAVAASELSCLEDHEVSLKINGTECANGSGFNVLRSPLEALVWLAKQRDELGDPLRAGTIIMTGAAAGPVPVDPGDKISVSFTSPVEKSRPLGDIDFKFSLA